MWKSNSVLEVKKEREREKKGLRDGKKSALIDGHKNSLRIFICPRHIFIYDSISHMEMVISNRGNYNTPSSLSLNHIDKRIDK